MAKMSTGALAVHTFGTQCVPMQSRGDSLTIPVSGPIVNSVQGLGFKV